MRKSITTLTIMLLLATSSLVNACDMSWFTQSPSGQAISSTVYAQCMMQFLRLDNYASLSPAYMDSVCQQDLRNQRSALCAQFDNTEVFTQVRCTPNVTDWLSCAGNFNCVPIQRTQCRKGSVNGPLYEEIWWQ